MEKEEVFFKLDVLDNPAYNQLRKNLQRDFPGDRKAYFG